MVADPQLSVAVAIPLLSVLVEAWQSIVLFAGQVICGAMLSLIVMICEQVAVLPQTSDALYVLVTVYLFTQLKFDVTSLTNVTVAVPEQLSVVVTDPGFGCGMDDAHVTVTGTGQVMVGATLSLTVMI